MFVKNLHFHGGTWIVHNLKTDIENCDLSELNLKVSYAVYAKQKTYIRFSKCELGSTHIHNARDVTIQECSSYELDRKNETLLTLKNSKVRILNSTFENNSGQSIINSLNGTSLYLEDSAFKRNNVKSGVIHLEQSTLRLQKTSFSQNRGQHNGGCINAWDHSDIRIENSTFFKNSAKEAGGAIYISGHVQLNVLKTLFSGNSANSAGAITVYQYSNVHISDSNFTGNQGESYTGTIKVYDHSSLTLVESVLSHNAVEQSVGVVSAGDNSSLNIFDCSFENNTSQLKNAGVIYLEVDTKLVIKRSTFIQNRAAQIGGVLNMYKNCSAEIYQSFFAGNTAGDI